MNLIHSKLDSDLVIQLPANNKMHLTRNFFYGFPFGGQFLKNFNLIYLRLCSVKLDEGGEELIASPVSFSVNSLSFIHHLLYCLTVK